jgi:hypothetical protein
MTPATRTGLHVLGTGLAVGLVTDLLLPVEPWGLNLLLCTAALVGAGAWVVRRAAVTPSGDAAWLAISALLLGAAFVRRDAELLQVLDVLTLIGVFGLLGAAAAGVSLRHAEVGRYVAAVARSAFSTVTGGVQLLFSDVSWSDVPLGSRLGRFRGVALGILLAVPLLFVFGSLFASADAAFAQALSTILRVDLSTAAEHTFRTAVLGGLAAGYLRGIALPSRADTATRLQPRTGADVPVITALVLLNTLFLIFVVIQLRYFFGGAGRIEAVAGLTYAEYARRGFFELVSASALVAPVLLGSDWAVRGAPAPGLRRFRIAAAVTLALMAVVITSALGRMRLYVAAFGLTEDRLYATAGMVFLTLALAWLGWTVLRGRAGRFAFGATIQGLAVLAGLHTLNPDAFILRHNLARPGAERPFDAKYAATLGADAAPGLLAALPSLAPDDACVVARRLAQWAARDTDWRTWNWARAQAARLGREPLVTTTVAACPAEPPTSKP